MKTNYHTHCSYCDGAGDPETVVLAALGQGFDILGFSSHQPLDGEDWTMGFDQVSDYQCEIQRLAKKYKDEILILCGMERDFNPSLPPWPERQWEGVPLDFVIGSVHAVFPDDSGAMQCVDGPAEKVRLIIRESYGGNARRMVEDYYRSVAQMVRREKIDFVGHLDVVKKQNLRLGFLNESEGWYIKTVKAVLEEIRKKDIPVEINTGGLSRGCTEDIYPSPPILRECCRLDIPVLINSDAHKPEDLGFAFDQARYAAREAGYRTHLILDRYGWKSISF
jgi:histidinol-phosphatase (PHP family)